MRSSIEGSLSRASSCRSFRPGDQASAIDRDPFRRPGTRPPATSGFRDHDQHQWIALDALTDELDLDAVRCRAEYFEVSRISSTAHRLRAKGRPSQVSGSGIAGS